MKRFFVFALLFAVLLTACAPVAAGLVALPDEGSLLVVTLVTAGVAWLLLKLSEAIGLDLGGYVQPIVAIIAPILITFIESYLQLIPPVFDDLVLSVIHVLVLLAGSLGMIMAVNHARAKTVKASLLK